MCGVKKAYGRGFDAVREGIQKGMMTKTKGRSGISEMKSPMVGRELQAGGPAHAKRRQPAESITLGENQEGRVEKRE